MICDNCGSLDFIKHKSSFRKGTMVCICKRCGQTYTKREGKVKRL